MKVRQSGALESTVGWWWCAAVGGIAGGVTAGDTGTVFGGSTRLPVPLGVVPNLPATLAQVGFPRASIGLSVGVRTLH